MSSSEKLDDYEMKVGLITDKLDKAKITGHGRYIYELVKHLQKLEDKEFELKLIHYKRKNLDIYNDRNQIILKNAKILLNPLFLRKKALDLIHFPSQNVSPLFWISNKKIIVTIHGIDFAFARIDRKAKNYTNILRYFKNQISIVIAPTENAAKCISSYFSLNNVISIHHGVDRNKFYPIENKEIVRKYIKNNFSISEKFFFHMSTLKSYKNFYPLLLGFIKNLEMGYNINLVIAGGGKNQKDYYRKYIKEKFGNKVLSKVYFLDYISDKELRYFYNLAEALVNPSFESFGFPLVEAMACGCPIIFGNGYGAKNVVSSAGIGVSLIGRRNHYDFNELTGCIERNQENYYKVSEEISYAMKKLIENDNYRKKLMKSSLKRSKEFTWEKTANQHMKVYKKIYNSK